MYVRVSKQIKIFEVSNGFDYLNPVPAENEIQNYSIRTETLEEPKLK